MAKFENTDTRQIRKVGATGRPMIISTGIATVTKPADAALEAGCRDLILLKCTSTYPATPENTNILTIPHLRELFGCEVGLSDHTMGIGVAVASVALGATVIEKHFTLARARRRRLGLLDGAGRDEVARGRDRACLAGAGAGKLWADRGGAAVAGVSPVSVRG